MALLDKERGQVVVRVVYDGPALAGKTTTLRALARSLGRPLFSGDEAEGRTLHFDWLDYVGGRFEGYAIRCQVVAVPGQTALASRRMRLLDAADAVVFVADSRASALDESLSSLQDLQRHLQGLPAPQPGVVLQANKRDAADAASLEEMRARLRVGQTVGVTESVATDGAGIRETFVFAVRLALDLVRERLSNNMLDTGPPAVDSGAELMATLLAVESGAAVREPSLARPVAQVSAVPAPTPPHTASSRPAAASDPPWPPDASVASGLVWPPIEGRQVLHEAHSLNVEPRRMKNGDWWAIAGGEWRCHSPAAAEFLDLDSGREALVAWARWHAGVSRWLSPHRCIALCRSGPSKWRLWQIARRAPAIADQVVSALGSDDVDAAALALFMAVDVLAEADARLAPLGLPVSASTVARSDHASTCYVGLVPRNAAAQATARSVPERIRETLSPVVRKAAIAPGLSIPLVLERLKAHAPRLVSHEAIETVQAILIGH